MRSFSSSLAPALAAVGALAVPAGEELDTYDDAALLDLQRDLAAARQRIDAASAVVAAAIARRSTREQGYSGLAQRLGLRTPEALVQRVTGASARDARALVHVGSLPAESPVAVAVRTGALTVAAASAIATGLGSASDRVASDRLETAARELVREAAGRTVEQLRARARDLRDELDAEAVRDRARAQRERRYLHLYPLDDGMTRLVGLLDPESAALVSAVIDAATSPRRGGPRFTDAATRAEADAVVADTRTTDQLALDAVVGTLQAGTDAAPSELPGARSAGRAAVQVIVAERDLDVTGRGAELGGGAARIEGQPTALPASLAERRACADGLVAVVVADSGAVLRVGRQRRLFSRSQRVALAVRDGGCRFPGCERPPSWCEAHHVIPWSHGGATDVDDGVLLCRHHHLLIHDNGWRVERDGPRFFVVPPETEDPLRRRIPMPSRSPVLARAIA